MKKRLKVLKYVVKSVIYLAMVSPVIPSIKLLSMSIDHSSAQTISLIYVTVCAILAVSNVSYRFTEWLFKED